MATLTIRDVDDDVRDRLRVIAAANGRSMEAELRALVVEHVRRRDLRPTIAEAAAAFRREVGGIALALPLRDEVPELPDLS